MQKVNLTFKSGNTTTLKLEDAIAQEMKEVMFLDHGNYKIPNLCVRLKEIVLLEILNDQ